MQTLPMLASDPSLERLLLAIVVAKGMITLAVLGLVRWRLRHPILRRQRLLYVSGAVSLGVAMALLLTGIAGALVPFLFDGALALTALVMLTDSQVLVSLARRFPRPDPVQRPPGESVTSSARRVDSPAHAGEEHPVVDPRILPRGVAIGNVPPSRAELHPPIATSVH